jgi:putative membrane protein|tara:strand:- start:83 stop:541 length:459 start_codon:yes stop_codon:yes gene_type:complete
MQSFNNFLVNNYSLIKAFHVISMVAWMAALLYLPRLFVYHTTVKKNSDTSEMLKIMELRLQKYIMNPAMLLTLLFGIFLLKTGELVNWGEKWIYFKLLAVFLLLLVHYLLAKYRKDFFLNKNRHSKKFYKILNEIPTILLILIILLVYLKPF